MMKEVLFVLSTLGLSLAVMLVGQHPIARSVLIAIAVGSLTAISTATVSNTNAALLYGIPVFLFLVIAAYSWRNVTTIEKVGGQLNKNSAMLGVSVGLIALVTLFASMTMEIVGDSVK